MKEICVALINGATKIGVTLVICSMIWALDERRFPKQTETEDE